MAGFAQKLTVQLAGVWIYMFERVKQAQKSNLFIEFKFERGSEEQTWSTRIY